MHFTGLLPVVKVLVCKLKSEIPPTFWNDFYNFFNPKNQTTQLTNIIIQLSTQLKISTLLKMVKI